MNKVVVGQYIRHVELVKVLSVCVFEELCALESNCLHRSMRRGRRFLIGSTDRLIITSILFSPCHSVIKTKSFSSEQQSKEKKKGNIFICVYVERYSFSLENNKKKKEEEDEAL
jgi:hypothetical protein